MSKTVRTALLALAAGGLLAAPALDARERVSGEAKLAKLLDGRVAGEPESCIRTFPHTDLTVIDGTALVYKQGRTLWVNRTHEPRDIDDNDALVSRQFGAQLCRTDIVTTIDRNAGFYTGNIFLSDFVPYRRPG
jgi:hypothetical protein